MKFGHKTSEEIEEQENLDDLNAKFDEFESYMKKEINKQNVIKSRSVIVTSKFKNSF